MALGQYLCLAVILLFVFSCQGENLVGKSSATRYGEHNNYYLYSRDNPRVADRVYATAASATAARTMRAKTVILVHGQGGNHLNTFNTNVKDALLTSEDVSVIVVDWTLYAAMEAIAPLAVPEIGAGLANLVRFFVNGRRITLENLHLIGHGLGAHVVSHAARLLITGNVARITGLDPSNLIIGLSANDANYVEVIHTDIDNSGIANAIGTVDFYPNGGSSQPGCTAATDTTTADSCNHNRAWQLYAASLTDTKLVGNQCDGDVVSNANCRGFTLVIGNDELNKFGSGSFYVETGDKYPYFNELNCVVTCLS